MFRRILLALDAGEAGSVATSFTVALARDRGAAVHVVHVDQHLFGPRGLVPGSPAPGSPGPGSPGEASGVVAAALKDLHAAGVSATGVTYRAAWFSIPAVVCDLAECVRADVIVVGSRRRRAPFFLPFFLPPGRSARARIARRSPLPVVTAPAPLTVGKRGRTLPERPPSDISVRS